MRVGLLLAVVAVVCGCPRIVAPARVTLGEVSVSPERPVRAGLVSDDTKRWVCGFTGDVITVSGAGWNQDTAQIRIGGITLEPLVERSAERLSAEVPLDVPDGPVGIIDDGVLTVSDRYSYCHFGNGHPPEAQFAGLIEPVVTISASGVAGTRCPLAIGGLDGGPAASAYCEEMAAMGGTLAVSFTLGPIQSYKDPQLVARIAPFAGITQLGELPASTPPDEVRIVHNIAPHAVDGGVASAPADMPAVTVHEGLLLDDGAQLETRLWMAGERIRSATTSPGDPRLVMTQLMRHEGRWLVGELDATGHTLHVLPPPPGGSPLEGLRIAGLPTAAGVVGLEWFEYTQAYLAAASLPTKGSLFIEISRRVEPDGTMSPELAVYYVALLDEGPVKVLPLCPALATGGSCVSNEGVIAPAETLAPAGCGGDRGCLTCFASLGAWPLPWDTAGLEVVPASRPGMLVLAPPRPVSPVDPAAIEGCLLNSGLPLAALSDLKLRSIGVLHVDPAVPIDAADGGVTSHFDPPTILAVPQDIFGGRTLARISFTEGFTLIPTRADYAFVHADPTESLLYALPAKGHRVDVLDSRGVLLRSVSVFGAPREVHWVNDATPNVVAIYDEMMLRMDESGGIAAWRHRDLLPGTALWDITAGRATTAWVPEAIPSQQDALQLVQVDVTSEMLPANGPRFGDALHTVRLPDTAAVWVEPVGVAERYVAAWLVGVGGQGSCAAPAAGAPTYRLVVLNREDGAVVSEFCDVFAARYEPFTQIVYAIVAVGNQQVEFRLVDLAADAPVLIDPGTPPVISAGSDPSGGAVGVFFNFDTWEYELARMSYDRATGEIRYERIGPAPFAHAAVAISPDGKRLYAGESDVITEFEIDRAGGGVRVLRQIRIDGRPDTLSIDSAGEHLLYVSQHDHSIGLVR